MVSNSLDIHGGAKATKLPGSGDDAILYTESIDSLWVLRGETRKREIADISPGSIIIGESLGDIRVDRI